ncbi:NUDIX domain-containing protein [Jongsikchunia kroppenstedtii]|uniref:NUDIX domain-containing protein n=1 Tax=Jongsikchunia kroppenstedtii TaxID=1121721 RepID=UPI00036350EF|nr:NUDIX domain-containing protein [Jongsikchunia kroppenstedtii]
MSVTSLHRSAVDLLTDWDSPNTDQDVLRHTMLAFLDSAPRGCLRAWEPGHITASAIVFNAARTHVLLTLHPRVGKWLQLGGHCEESDPDIAAAATREAREEAGIPDLPPVSGLARITTHPITCSLGKPTRHLDMQFVCVAAGSGDELPAIAQSAESVDLAWWPVSDLPADAERPGIPELITAGLSRLP